MKHTMFETVEYIGCTKEDKVRKDGTHYNACTLMLKTVNGCDNVNMKETVFDQIQALNLAPLSPVQITVEVDPSKDYPSGIYMVSDCKKVQQSTPVKPTK